jgi:P27 family predicted phage terminase small subunit
MLDGMGTRGPLPLPENVRRLRGSARKAPTRPQAVKATPVPPRWLSPEARAEWKRVTPELERIGLLSTLDRAVLSTYCGTWARFVEVSRLLDASSATAPDPTHPDRPAGGIRKHPMWGPYFSLGSQLSSLAKDLGLSPAARARLTVPDFDDTDDDGILD